MLRFDARRFLVNRLRLFDARYVCAWLFHTGSGSGLGNRLAMWLRVGLLHFRLTLHFQAVFLELLCVKRLLRVLLPGLLVRPAATVGTIAPVAAATATAPAIASATARFAAFLLGLTIAVRTQVGCLGLALLLLLRRARRTLIGAAFALRTLGGLIYALRRIDLRLDLGLRNIGWRTILPARRTVLARLLLLRRTLIAALLVIAALVVAPTIALRVASAIGALLVIAPAVAVAARLAVAPGATVTAAAAMIVAVA